MNGDSAEMPGDRRLTIAVWAGAAVITLSMIALVLTGAAPGLGPDRHPPEYLIVSNIAIFLLISVVPVLRLTGIVRMPWWFNFILFFDVYLYIISLTMGFYMDPGMPWWGGFGHLCSSVAVGGICFLALCLVKKHSPVRVGYGSTAGFIVILFFTTVTFGGIWEVLEGYVDLLTGTAYMSYGVVDSLGDLQADTLGAVVICIIAAVILRNRTVDDVADSVKLKLKLRFRARARISFKQVATMRVTCRTTPIRATYHQKPERTSPSGAGYRTSATRAVSPS